MKIHAFTKQQITAEVPELGLITQAQSVQEIVPFVQMLEDFGTKRGLQFVCFTEMPGKIVYIYRELPKEILKGDIDRLNDEFNQDQVYP